VKRLTKKQQALVTEYQEMVLVIARYFVQNRPGWQRAALIPDLEGEGYLALCKAARTYNKDKLPYPKRYFAQAILNAMLKSIRKMTRSPGERVGMAMAEAETATTDERDDLSEAIAGMEERDKAMAVCRFVRKRRITDLADEFNLNVRSASLASRRIAKQLLERLGILDELPDTAHGPRRRSTKRPSPCQSTSSPASLSDPSQESKRCHGKTCPAPSGQGRGRRSLSQNPEVQSEHPGRGQPSATRRAARPRKDGPASSGRQRSPGSAGRSSPAQTQRKRSSG
jgi:RNA polymerase sigma factor (sigma-70 family)